MKCVSTLEKLGINHRFDKMESQEQMLWLLALGVQYNDFDLFWDKGNINHEFKGSYIFAYFHIYL